MKTDYTSVVVLIEESLNENEKVPELLLYLLYRLSLEGYEVPDLVSHLEYWEVTRQYHEFIRDEMSMKILGKALIARMEFFERQDKASLEAFRECCDTDYVKEMLQNNLEIFLRVDKVVMMAIAQARSPKKTGDLPAPPSTIGTFFRNMRKSIAVQLTAELNWKK
jgi:hypothetical protein